MFATDSSVWIVDDDDDDQLLARSAFKAINPAIQVVAFYDGDQLLPALASCEQLPRLILLDINMVRQNGFETLVQLRNTPDFEHLPVVVLTTSSNEEDRQRCLALRADKVLIKPPSYNQLTLLIQELSRQWILQ